MAIEGSHEGEGHTCSSNALFALLMNESIRPCHAAYSPAVSLRACKG